MGQFNGGKLHRRALPAAQSGWNEEGGDDYYRIRIKIKSRRLPPSEVFGLAPARH